MPVAAPVLWEVARSWWFWCLFVLFFLLGIGLRYLDTQVTSFVCEGYKAQFKAGVDARVWAILAGGPAPATMSSTTSPMQNSSRLAEQVCEAIQSYFCDFDRPDPASDAVGDHSSPRVPPPDSTLAWLKRWIAITVASLAMAFLLSLVLPRPLSARAIAQRIQGADHLPAGISPSYVARLTREGKTDEVYANLSLRARQLVIAVTYAVFTGLATVIVRPQYSEPPAGWSWFANYHVLALCVAALAAVCWGAWSYAATEVPTFALAVRLGLAPIFMGGLISTCISLPYQMLRPATMFPLEHRQLLSILLIRLFVLPLVSTLGLLVLRNLMRTLVKAIVARAPRIS